MDIIEEIKTEEINNKNILECGKVFVTNSRWFILNCCLCGIQLDREKFFEHIIKVHFDIEFNSNLDLETKEKNSDETFLQNATVQEQKWSDNSTQSLPEKLKESPEEEVKINLESLENSVLINTRNTAKRKTKDVKLGEENTAQYSNQRKMKKSEEKQKNQNLQYKQKNGNVHCCDICNLKLNKRKELLNHKRNKCGFRCSLCSLILKEENLLRAHLKKHNNRKSLEKNQKVFVCEICGKDFNDSSNLRAHIKKHDPTRKIYPCEKCDKKFLKETSLENHFKLKHLKDKPFVCKVALCGRRFVNEKSLENHKAFHGERKYECSICKKKYLYKSKLKEHVKLYHIQGRIHHCPECDKSFYDQWTLKSHMVCHSSEKPYECDECEAKFPREKALIWHKKVHSGVKDYICKLCNQAFYIYNGLYAHMKSHNIQYSKNMEKDLLLMSNEQNNKNIENE